MPVPMSFTVFYNTIDGKSRSSNNVSHGTDPSTCTPLWPVPIATKNDLNDAVSVAQKAFKTWSKTTWSARQEYLTAMRQALMDHKEEMTTLLIKECGKPVSHSTLLLGVRLISEPASKYLHPWKLIMLGIF
jgi:acyl-CoA reductase-like NAD-dependent aldehyde dehydrogenase